eukprot:scaffold34099_cov222-Skeletonema_dohrnii-CCMP3373.AAC.1
MSSNDIIPAAIGDDQSLHSPSSSAPPAPERERRNMMHLADETTAAEELSADEVAIIFSFLPHQDIMHARVCKTWRDAAKKTLVPLCGFRIDNVRSYNAMRVMATALPNLQQLSIRGLGWGHNKYVNGEDPDELKARRTANFITHDIDIISSFTKLRVLHIEGAHLNGSYPVLFSFPLLEKLIIKDCEYLKWDLEMLQGLPSLKGLDCDWNSRLTGSLRSLGALKDSLEKVCIYGCFKIFGNLMDLADFPRLKKLDLLSTKVTGDIRDIGVQDFPALESLALPRTVHGGTYYEFQRISDVPIFMHTIHLLLQRTPTLFVNSSLLVGFYWSLSDGSPDWYDGEADAGDSYTPLPPFNLQIVQAGSRRGWRWCTCTYDDGHSCEINWLDPEPSSESSDYEAYIEDLQRIEQLVDVYRGYYEPPNEQQYRRLCECEGEG